MRWIWIDRIIEFQSGSFVKAVKNVSLSEEHLHDHFPGFPVMPASLITEGLAQSGGVLVGEYRQFQNPVVLAKIPKMVFHSWACPGDTITYHVKMCDVNDQGGMVECTAHVGDRLVAEGEIMFAHLPANATGGDGQKKNFVFSTRLLAVMDVGKFGDGTRPTPTATGG